MKALILVDLQNDFFEGGSLGIKDSNKIIVVINKLIDIFNENHDLIIATKDYHPKNHISFNYFNPHCIQNTKGSKIHKDINIKNINKIIYKGQNIDVDSYSGFFDNDGKNKTELDEYLKENNIKTLYIVGLATDFCVKYTSLDAIKLGYDVYVIKDACKGIKEETEVLGAKYISFDEFFRMNK